MSQVTNELIYETLKNVQSDISILKTDTSTLKETTGRIDIRLKSVEAHMSGFMSSARYLETEIDELRGRVEALEEHIDA